MLWAIALLLHLAGNSHHLSPVGPIGAAQIVMAGLAVLSIVRPGPRPAVGLALVHLAITAAKLPHVGNHEIILALVDLVVVGAVVRGVRRATRSAWTQMAAPALRPVLLVAYGAIAFSKLNRGFLDPAVSCAAVFGDELGRWVDLRPSTNSGLSAGAIGATVLIELAVPILLVAPRTRLIGVWLGLLFHFVLALDPTGHVFDFSSALVPLFLLFLPPAGQRRLDAAVLGLRANRTGAEMALTLAVAMALHGAVLVSGAPRWAVAWPLWLVVAVSVMAAVRAATGPSDGPDASPHSLMPPRWAWPVVVLAVAVAVGPYLEVRSAASFNMYANLRVAGGASNHLVVPASPAGGRELVRLISVSVQGSHDTAESALADALRDAYVGVDVLVPLENVRHLVHERPGLEIVVDGIDTSTSPHVVDRAGWGWRDELAHRLLHRRVVSTDESPTCARSWGLLG